MVAEMFLARKLAAQKITTWVSNLGRHRMIKALGMKGRKDLGEVQVA
jgi:hypothetical protein